MDGVSLARIYRLFRLRCCRVHSCLEAPFGKGWVGRNPYGHYHITHRGEGVGGVPLAESVHADNLGR